MAGRFRPLTLQQKVTVALVSIVGALVGVCYLVLSTTIRPAFESLERTVAEINLVRAKRAVEAELESLAAVTGDWGRGMTRTHSCGGRGRSSCSRT